MQRRGLRILSGLLAFLCATTFAAPRFELPPLVQPQNSEHHIGKMIWADLVISDLDAAKRFYGALFGWTFRDIRAGDEDYAIAYAGARPIAGLVRKTLPDGERRQSAWLTFFAVHDVDVAKKTALANGAKVIAEPRNYPNRGTQAVFADPEAAIFAVLASRSGDPPDVLAGPGEWIWTSLIAKDPNAAAAFYQKMFGYEVFALPSDDDVEHLVLANDRFARVMANGLPTGKPTLHSHWVNFVRVLNVKDAAAKATSLGGRVLVEPHPDRNGGQVTIIADPAGAPFGLMEWSGESEEGARR